MKQERQHNNLIQDVENFSTDRLKRAATQEKIVLPNAQGIFVWPHGGGLQFYNAWCGSQLTGAVVDSPLTFSLINFLIKYSLSFWEAQHTSSFPMDCLQNCFACMLKLEF